MVMKIIHRENSCCETICKNLQVIPEFQSIVFSPSSYQSNADFPTNSSLPPPQIDHIFEGG